MPVVRARPIVAAIFLAVLIAAGSPPSAARAQTQDSLEKRVREQTETTLGGLVREGRSSFAAAVFVSGGVPRFSASYGTEAPGSRVPFSVDSTLIDLNSINKIFTAIAIAQLVDRGKIASIDDPINKYLKHYRLPLAFGHEVSIRAIATHSAGFDLPAFGAGKLESDPARFFDQRFPGYFRNDALFSAYENYGPKLLAFMVAEVSGEAFPRYVEQSILRPLGMDHTYLVATPRALEHRFVAFQVKAPTITDGGPPLKAEASAMLVGTSVSTLSDVAKMMGALLGPDGAQDAVTEPMRRLIFQVLQTNGERGAAHGLIFDAVRQPGKTLFTHGGVGPGINCMMDLDIGAEAGVFFCYANVRVRFDDNPADSPPAFEDIGGRMLKPFTACAADTGDDCTHYPAPAWKNAWNAYLGDYVDSARHHHGFSRLRTLLHPTFLRIEREGQSLKLDGHAGFVEISPGSFGSPSYTETFSFIKDPATGKLFLSTSDRPSAYERPSLLEKRNFLPRLLAVLVATALSGGLFALPTKYGINARARLAAVGYAAVVACSIASLFGLRAFGASYFEGISWPLQIIRVCGFLTIPASVVLIYQVHDIDRRPLTGIARIGRLHLNVICLSAVVMTLTLLACNLISFSPIT